MIREFYPAIEPYNQGHLQVSEQHLIYFEESGNPAGQPAVFVHGGPGGGTEPKHRGYFDPKHYRIILFDQRGCGKSTPNASLEENTTWDLVSDMEKIREHLRIEKWLVFGGSWGSTLSLAYSEKHPERVTHLVLRGIFLVRKWEIDWLYQSGADAIFPDLWENYLAPIPVPERGDILTAYHNRLTSPDRQVQLEAARAWSTWEGSTSKLLIDPAMVDHYSDGNFAIAFARIECHYFVNKGFMEDGKLLRDVERIRHIPTVIVQGRYDVVCPMRSAWDLHRTFSEAKLIITPTSGHSAFETENRSALIEATDAFRE
jgi:proline iminopeptidase